MWLFNTHMTLMFFFTALLIFVINYSSFCSTSKTNTCRWSIKRSFFLLFNLLRWKLTSRFHSPLTWIIIIESIAETIRGESKIIHKGKNRAMTRIVKIYSKFSIWVYSETNLFVRQSIYWHLYTSFNSLYYKFSHSSPNQMIVSVKRSIEL